MDERKKEAILAADFVRALCPKLKGQDNLIGIILGTGWDVLQNRETRDIPLSDIPGFSGLSELNGHARVLSIGYIAGKLVIALRGRIHLNEAPNDPNIARLVRLQTELLIELGVKTLIVTSAVGSLSMMLEVGTIAIIDGFITLYAPEMPLWAGEFCSPDDAIDEKLIDIASAAQREETRTHVVSHAMLRGPFFEGRKYDKPLLAESGAKVVGMSMLPEACVAALRGIKILCLGFITNSMFEVHSHETNQARAEKVSAHLADYLIRIISRI